MNPVHILIAYFLNSHLNIILQSTTTSPKQHHSFKSSDHILFIFVHPLYDACPSNLILLAVLYTKFFMHQRQNSSHVKLFYQFSTPQYNIYRYKENCNESLFFFFILPYRKAYVHLYSPQKLLHLANLLGMKQSLP